MKTKPERDPSQTAQCVYSIPCGCDRSYNGETGRPLAVKLLAHRYNFKEGLIEKLKLSHHGYKEGLEIIRECIERIGLCGMSHQSDQPAPFGHFSHLDPPYQQLNQPTQGDQYAVIESS
jgi:hypothetical protein